jgi:hypothetical protein
MSVSNGIYRIAQLIRGISRVFGGLLILVNAYALIFLRVQLKERDDAVAVLLVTVFFMVVAEAIAWILEGFAKD